MYILQSQDYWRNQKPAAGSQIDWGHPLSKGLVGCWLFNGTLQGLVGPGMKAWKAPKFTDSGILTKDGCVSTLNKPFDFTSGNWSYALRFRDVQETPIYNTIILNKGAYFIGGEYLYRMHSTNDLAWDIYKNNAICGQIYFSGLLGYGRWINWVTTSKTYALSPNLQDYCFYYNGKREIGAVQYAGGYPLENNRFPAPGSYYNPNPLDNADMLTVGGQTFSNMGAEWAFDKYNYLVSYLYIYRRALSADEAKELDQAPYQLLIPPEPQVTVIDLGRYKEINPESRIAFDNGEVAPAASNPII